MDGRTDRTDGRTGWTDRTDDELMYRYIDEWMRMPLQVIPYLSHIVGAVAYICHTVSYQM